jgi:microcystin-dependent protein
MPFNGSGTFTAINTFVPNTTILSAAVNANFADIATGLSDCLTRDGQAGMTAALGITSGTVNAPGLKFNSEAGSGLYLAGTGQVGISIASATGFTFSASTTAAGGGILGQAGAVLLPVGCIHDFAGTAAPTGWLLCFGQEVSQASYTQLFAVIGSAWGTASTATAFIIPDLRGRALYGKDDMGGSAANRITSAVSSVNGTSLGAVGGSQSHTQSAAEVGSHTHTVTDPGHLHGVDGGGTIYGGTGFTNSISLGGASSGVVTAVQIVNDLAITNVTINAGGGGTPFTVLNPAAIVNKIIFTGHG